MMFDYADVSTSGDERPYYFTLDRQYNVRGVVDRAGALVEIYKYDEYGRLRIRECPARGDMDNDGANYNTKAAVDRVRFDAVSTGTKWDPRADLTDDGAVDVGDSTQRTLDVANWYPASTPVVSHAFSGIGNRFGWQGRPHYAIDTTSNKTDGVLMLIDHRLRMHDPVLGRWLTRDPIGYNGGTFNLYEYIRSNPLCFRDPNGEEVWVEYEVGISFGADGKPFATISYFINKSGVDTRNGNWFDQLVTRIEGALIDEHTREFAESQNVTPFPGETVEEFEARVQRLAANGVENVDEIANSDQQVEDIKTNMKGLAAAGALATGAAAGQLTRMAVVYGGEGASAFELALASSLLGGGVECGTSALLLNGLTTGDWNAAADAGAQAFILGMFYEGLFGCFPEGTLIILADGSEKPIEQVEVGDLVLCVPSPESDGGETGGVVARTFVHEVDRLLDLSIAIDGECVTLTTTPEHRFYVPERCEFIAAGELEPGVRFRTTEAGSEAVLVEKHLREMPATVYNFHVAVALDYFVKPCEDCPGILVHNRKWIGGGGNLTAQAAENPILGKPRVGSGLKQDLELPEILKPGDGLEPTTIIKEFPATPRGHGFPDVVDNFAGMATVTKLERGAVLYQLEGSFNGVDGRFEWIVQNGAVTHRFFVGGGTMNGVPIQK